jgi:hypothetical protein
VREGDCERGRKAERAGEIERDVRKRGRDREIERGAGGVVCELNQFIGSGIKERIKGGK